MRLELDSFSAVYQRGTPFEVAALSGVSLAVASGERLGIVGPAGSGKTTLLEALAGMVPPAAGSAIHDGRVLGRRQEPEAGALGIAFQSPEDCLFAGTVFDDVAFGPRRLGLAAGEVERRAVSSLEAVGLDPVALGPRNPFGLSAGEQRRVALAGVLSLEPRALLLDEPTAYLDAAAAHDICENLLALSRKRGITLVVAGHDADEIARLAGRVVVLDNGFIAGDGPAEEILADIELLGRHGLEPPATVELTRLLARATGKRITAPLDEDAALEELLAAAGRAGTGGGV